MVIFDKNTIESFANKVDDEVVETALSNLSFILTNAINDIRKRNPYISENFEILKINEFYSGAILPNSSLDVMLVLNSPQLEFNTVKLIKKKFSTFVNRLKFSLKNSKKTKKRDKYIATSTENLNKEKTNYTIPIFEKDLLNAVANYITPMTIVSINNGVLQINGEDLAFKVNIFPVINKFGSYNFYLYNKNKFLNIDYKNRFEILEYMQKNFGEKFINLIRIFNALYFNLYGNCANSLLIESLIFNLPDETYNKNTNYEMFVFAVNFLANSKISSLISITDFSKKIFQDKLCSASVLDIVNFIKDIKKFSM